MSREFTETVVVASSRTPLAKAVRGSFNLTRPDDMMAHCLGHVLAKAPGLAAGDVDNVVIGCGYPEGTQGTNVARIAVGLSKWPTSVAATTVNRFCASGLEAVAQAARQIMTGDGEVVVGGGVESITSLVNHKDDPNPKLMAIKPAYYMAMGETAEIVAKRYKISRQAQDEYSLISQQRTARAQAEGRMDSELAPMEVTRGLFDKKTKQMSGSEKVTLSRDECNRADTTMEGLSGLKPVFDPDNGTVTAGSSSQMSDGASANLLMSRARAEKLGVKPLVSFRGYAVSGCDPDEMGVGPVFAVPKLLAGHGLKVDDIDLWELNEAFAVQVIYCRDRLGISMDKLNVNGGSISIGHPFGMTGARMVGTIAYEMKRRGARLGVVTMCVGGGQGAAALFELCEK